ncbi:COMM domain-containing protein 4 [Phlebotomus argentipes]|uniref:COMM domain-containing protein 4 n=1 Tax=Phlebotomus argentipes TaxID=94469 RepID=UPI0028932313|nr:COMM domain-containing protein 4 [Phlebotomus argentipes]
MKFRFCGDGDCPDWILAEIHSTLSVLSSVKLRVLAQMVAKSTLGEEIPEEKLLDTMSANKLDLKAARSAFACLRYILTSAVRHNTPPAVFEAELQQLGLPKEHSAGICRTLGEFSDRLQDFLSGQTLSVNELEDVSCAPSETHPDCVNLSLGVRNEIVNGLPQKTEHCVTIHGGQLPILIKELKTARDVVERLS